MRYIYTPYEEIMRGIYNDARLLHIWLTLKPTYKEADDVLE